MIRSNREETDDLGWVSSFHVDRFGTIRYFRDMLISLSNEFWRGKHTLEMWFRRVRPILFILTDFGIFAGCLTWWARWRFAGIYMPLGLSLLANGLWKKYRVVGEVFYFLVLVQVLDITILSLFPLWCVSRFALVLTVAAPLGGFLIFFRRYLRYARAWLYCISAVMFVSAVLVSHADKKPNDLRDAQCNVVANNPALEVLLDARGTNRELVRFLCHRPNKNDLIVTYRNPSRGPRAERLDLATKTATELPLPPDSECIGVYYDSVRDLLFLVYVTNPNYLRPEKYPKKLLILDGRSQFVKLMVFPEIEYCDYNAYMFPYKDKLVIQGESTFFLDLNTFALDRRDLRNIGNVRCILMAETGFVHFSDDRFVISGGGEPLLQRAVGGDAACLLDPRAGTVAIYRTAPLNGVWDVASVPPRDELLFSSFWRSSIMFVDAKTMREKRRFSLAPCARPVAYDKRTNLAYTVECFSGRLLAFDIDSGRIVSETKVGANSRQILVDDELGVVVASECGVYRVRRQPPSANPRLGVYSTPSVSPFSNGP